MTREEAITYFKRHIDLYCVTGICREAEEIAIKALEQEPTTKNNLGVDCISRAEAIKCLECDFDITGKENMKTVVNYINSAHDKIVNLPRVKQEPRKGHWTTVLHEEILFCSECHQRLVDEQTYIPLHYCPNCGARMVEPQESEGT